MPPKARLLSLFLISGLFLSADRFLKWQSLNDWSAPRLLNRFFGWEPSLNYGVAFSIPLPNPLIIALTIPIILIVVYLFAGEKKLAPKFALLMIIFGALSNLFDRIFLGHIVDYLLILTAVINLADAMIAAGFLLYFLKIKNRSPKEA